MNSQTERSRKPSVRSCFSLGSSKTLTAVAGAVGKVNIPLRLRDVQVQWENLLFGLFHGTAFSTALVRNRWYIKP